MEAGTLVLGIGNLLMGDEGVGIHVVRLLEEQGLPDGVVALDGGTGGFHLLGHLQAYRSVVLVDAAADGRPPGTTAVLHPRYASDYPPTLTAHDIGLKDLLDAMHLVGGAPDVTLVTVSVDGIGELGTELTDAVAGAVPAAANLVRAQLRAG